MIRIRKALVTLIAAAAAVGTQYLATKHFTLTTEGVTAIFGVVTAALVYFVPNLLSPGFAGVRKAIVPLGTALTATIVQLVATHGFGDVQELVTAVTGVLTALLVYWVPNAGQEHPETRPV
jgi:hypothetical protein